MSNLTTSNVPKLQFLVGSGKSLDSINGLRTKQSAVKQQREELYYMCYRYQRINDAIEGEHAIKYQGKKYLPLPSDCKCEEDKRYKAYETRAVYYNVCKPTRNALVGQIFLRPPVLELPDGLEFLQTDINGDGLTFEQLARKAANYILPFGRGGFLVDFPISEGEITRGEIESGEKRPTIIFFEPWAIRNWKVEKIGTVRKLTMLVLDECVERENGDEFDIETVIQQRVYRLEERGSTYCCTAEVYDYDGKSIEKHEICGKDGVGLDTIPFEPVGSKNNDMDIDEPPFENLASLNLAHYRNSADYEESVFLVGQPTPVYSGLTTDWMENYFPKGIPFGSRASITLNENANAQLLQALPNSLAFEAMTHKEKQMFSIGAKIINADQKIEKREKEVEIESASQKSVLMNVRNNLQMALFAAIQRAGTFIGIDVTEENSKLELNENFDLTSADPDELRASSERYAAGEVSLSEHREVLVRSGAAKLDLETFKIEAKADMEFKESTTPKPPEPAPGTVKPGDETKPKTETETKPQNGS